MRFRPRHYLLIFVILAVFVWNMYRQHHPREVEITRAPAPVVHTGPPPQSPGWTAFDATAALRDAPDSQYQPALKTLQDALPNDPNRADIEGCLTWLEFYRQGMAHAAADPEGKQRSIRHLNGCSQYHLDSTL